MSASGGSNNKRRRLDDDQFPPMMRAVHEGDVVVKASDNDDATADISTLLDLLRGDECPDLQLEAACCLTNMIHDRGTKNSTAARNTFSNANSGRDDDGHDSYNLTLVVTGAIPQLVRLLGTSPSFHVREQVVCALGNMARYSVQCRDAILEAGALPPLLEQLDPLISDDYWAPVDVDDRDESSQNKRTSDTYSDGRKLSMQCYGTWTLVGLCSSKPLPDFNLIRTALPTLARLLQYSDDELVLKQACTTVACLSRYDSMEKKQAVLAAGICPRLVALLDEESTLSPSSSSCSSWQVVQAAAVRTLAIIMSGNPSHHPHQTQIVIQHVLDCNNGSVLPRLRALLDSPVTEIRRHTCWAICNITTSSQNNNENHIQAVIDCNIIPPLIHLFVHSDDVDSRKQAFLTVWNTVARGTAHQVRYIVQQGCIAPIVNLLMVVSDPTMIRVTLVALEHILRVGQEIVDVSSSSMAAEAGSNCIEVPIHSRGINANPMARLIWQANGLEKIRTLRQRFAQDFIGTLCTRILQVYFDEVVEKITGIAPAA